MVARPSDGWVIAIGVPGLVAEHAGGRGLPGIGLGGIRDASADGYLFPFVHFIGGPGLPSPCGI